MYHYSLNKVFTVKVTGVNPDFDGGQNILVLRILFPRSWMKQREVATVGPAVEFSVEDFVRKGQREAPATPTCAFEHNLAWRLVRRGLREKHF